MEVLLGNKFVEMGNYLVVRIVFEGLGLCPDELGKAG